MPYLVLVMLSSGIATACELPRAAHVSSNAEAIVAGSTIVVAALVTSSEIDLLIDCSTRGCCVKWDHSDAVLLSLR